MSAKDDILKLIEKDFGQGIVTTGEDFLKREETKQVIPVGPALDVGLGGGIPEGSWVILSGRPKLGKSTLGLSFSANAQKAGKHVYYLDVEGRLKPMNLNGTNGLDTSPEKLTIIGSTEEKILSAQDYLTIAEKILLNHAGCVLIIDSFSALCHEKELVEGIGTSTRGGRGVLLSQFCGQMGNVVPVKRSIVIGMVHLMANTSGYGSSVAEKGGNAIQYQVDVKLRIKTAEPWVAGAGASAKTIGKIVTWVCECNALGAIPGQEIQSYLRYGYGIDDVYETIEVGKDLNLIKVAGSWMTCLFMEQHPELIEGGVYDEKLVKAQGGEKLYDLLQGNPKWLEQLKVDIKQLVA